MILFHVEYKKGVHTSGTQQLYWTLRALCDVISVRSTVLQEEAVNVYDGVHLKVL